MATNVDKAWTSVTAGQNSEFWRLAGIPGSHVNKDSFQSYLEGKNPFNNLFIFRNFFYTRPGLYFYEDSQMKSATATCSIPKEYKSIKTLSKDFDLEESMNDSAIIKKLGGEEAVRKNAVTWDQIEQMIQNQWEGKSGDLLNANIFYVIGENNVLFAVGVFWRSVSDEWRVYAYELGGYGRWFQGDRVFSNKPL